MWILGRNILLLDNSQALAFTLLTACFLLVVCTQALSSSTVADFCDEVIPLQWIFFRRIGHMALQFLRCQAQNQWPPGAGHLHPCLKPQLKLHLSCAVQPEDQVASHLILGSACLSWIALDTSTQTMQQQRGTTNNVLEVSGTRGTLSSTEYGASQRNDSRLHTKDINFSSKNAVKVGPHVSMKNWGRFNLVFQRTLKACSDKRFFGFLWCHLRDDSEYPGLADWFEYHHDAKLWSRFDTPTQNKQVSRD